MPRLNLLLLTSDKRLYKHNIALKTQVDHIKMKKTDVFKQFGKKIIIDVPKQSCPAC